ncbi:phosphatase PAP2 family protein [Moheibacter sediminis]|uniref:PAP2 superfamily protein n=1 Tax=Moheibacter sediminis TaxID=1434700 RepID=A0A1W2BSQ7_9FLAO|nr:phosphatase PAP2 family protein [Moheibacter sediminis]SMC76017.1 PAP2 superfamily protein [Moheibacter sediminis]
MSSNITKILMYITVLVSYTTNLFAQTEIDIVNPVLNDTLSNISIQENRLNYKNLIVPVVFVSYGIASLKVNELQQLNLSTRTEIHEHSPDHIRLDNYTQYAPAVMVYGLNAAGIKGKNNFKDRTIIYASSQLISAAFVVPLKHIVGEERPDGSNNKSFPSGHTATAFSSAQFMFREYKDSNFLLSISGYSFAVFTGVYRALNDKHWVGDIVAGAGFGILSTELAYFLYPKISSAFSGKNNDTMVIPFYQNKSFGIGLVKRF